MKKFLVIGLMAMILLSSTLPVMAEELESGSEVLLSETKKEIEVGEEVILKVETSKKGSTYVDSWNGCIKSETIYDEVSGNYVSTGVFKAKDPGVYTISYNIDMMAGKSENVFSKTVTEKIEVKDTNHITNLEINNLVLSEDKDNIGNVIGYNGIGEIQIVWSSGEITTYGTIFVYFGVNEISKDVNVEVSVEDEVFFQTITVNR